MSDRNVDAEILQRMEQVLEELRTLRPKYSRAVEHLEKAILCLRDPRGRIHPQDLNSANDG